MEETKSFLQSKTLWGTFVTVLSTVLALSGHALDANVQSSLIDLCVSIGAVIGTCLTIYGRITAKASLKGSSKSANSLLLLFAIPALLQGCALMNLQPHEQALAVGEELKSAYVALYDEYNALHKTLPPHQVLFMDEYVAPKMDMAKRALIAFRSAAAVYNRTKVEPTNYAKMKEALQAAIADCTALIAKAQTVQPTVINATTVEFQTIGGE